MNIIQSAKVSVAAVHDVKTIWLKDDTTGYSPHEPKLV